MEPIGPYRALKDPIGPYRALKDPIGPYLGALFCSVGCPILQCGLPYFLAGIFLKGQLRFGDMEARVPSCSFTSSFQFFKGPYQGQTNHPYPYPSLNRAAK
jgi:hypothetical protein